MLGDDPLAEPLERQPGRRRGEPVVALAERAQELRVALGQRRRQRPLDAGEERPLRSRARRSSTSASFETPTNGEARTVSERLVVVAVVEQPQVGEEVDDLLLAEVAAAGRAVGRQPGRAQLLLVPLGVGAGGEEEHDLARLGLARVDELADAPRDLPRLGTPPVHAGARVARLVGDEQLDRVPEDRVGELARRMRAAGTRRRSRPRRAG